MRASRLLSILLSLQTQGSRSASSLAEEMGTSIRTVYRDVDALAAAGVPIYAERGAGGGFRLLEGYKTRLAGVTLPEAQALMFTGLPAADGQLGMTEAHFASRLQILAALPDSLREEAVRLAARFHLDAGAWTPDEESLELLPQLAQAIWDQRRCHVEYQSWTLATARLVEPLGLVLKAGVWYLVAGGSGGPLTYRLSSIRSVVVTDAAFERDPDFDLPAYWRTAIEEFIAKLQKGVARLWIRTERVGELNHISAAVAQQIELLPGDPDQPDWREVRIPIESIDHTAGELLKFGPDLEVIEPADLRGRMHQAAVTMKALYERT